MPLPFGAIQAAILSGRAVVQAARLISKGFSRSGVGKWLSEHYYGADKMSVELAVDLGNAANQAANRTLTSKPGEKIDPGIVPITPNATLPSGETPRYIYTGLVEKKVEGVEGKIYRGYNVGSFHILGINELYEELDVLETWATAPHFETQQQIVIGMIDVLLHSIIRRY